MAKKPLKLSKSKQKAKPVLKAKAKGKPQKKAVSSAAKMKLPNLKAPLKQSEFFKLLAEQSGLVKKEVQTVVEGMKSIIKAHLVKSGPGQFKMPGFLKITAVNKPATKAKKGRNPFTGEEIMIKAKPVRRVLESTVFNPADLIA